MNEKLEEFIKDLDFLKLKARHAKEMIELLLIKKMPFEIVCRIDRISFNPQLPNHLNNFTPLTLFVIANYTLESARIEEEFFVFEAGFGKENFGSVVSVPVYDIVQILLDNTTIFLNLTDANIVLLEKERKEKMIEDNMKILLSNPENKRFKK